MTLQTEVLTYAADIDVDVDTVGVRASATALQNRKVWAVSITSDIQNLQSPAVASIDIALCNAQVSFNGLANAPGMIAKQKNAVNIAVQAAITPNCTMVQTGKEMSISFVKPFVWAVNNALNLITHDANSTPGTIHVDAVATIYYENG